MGATLAGCRAVPFLDLDEIAEDDAARALCLWVNVPGNPTGDLDDLGAAAAWGRAHDVPVLSDECYVEFTWDGPPRTIKSEEHTSELQSLMRISYAVFCLKQKTTRINIILS